MKYALTAAGLTLAIITAGFIAMTNRGVNPRLSCVADIAFVVLFSLLGVTVLFWRYDALSIPSRSFFEPDGEKRRDWPGRLVLAAIVGLGLLMIVIELAKCVLIGRHV